MAKAHTYIVKYFNLLLGILLVSIAFNLFLSPNGLAAGGIGGVSLIMHHFYGISISKFVLIADVILIVISYIFLGKEQTSRTLVGSLMFPLFISLTDDIPILIDIADADLFVKAIFGGVISGYGYGIIFKHGFTSGGTDIIDQIVTKYYKVSMGTSILLVDGLIVLVGGLAFGLENMIYAAITLVLISVCSNISMIEMNNYKTFYITTDKVDIVTDCLHKNFNYNTTIIDGKGGYSKTKRKIIMCVIRTNDYYLIDKSLKLIDPNIFVVITNSYEAINHGHKQ